MSSKKSTTNHDQDTVIKPSKEFASKARIPSMAAYKKLYKESIDTPEVFWAQNFLVEEEGFGGFGEIGLGNLDGLKGMEALGVMLEQDRVALLSPQGAPLNHGGARRLAGYERLILLCGRYEGVDERVREGLADEELSIGDLVLTGGELPALMVADAVFRFIPGVLGGPTPAENDSFANGLLESPYYTRPVEFRGQRVPEVLLSGDHGAIARWRAEMALEVTRIKRPDLLERDDSSSRPDRS